MFLFDQIRIKTESGMDLATFSKDTFPKEAKSAAPGMSKRPQPPAGQADAKKKPQASSSAASSGAKMLPKKESKEDPIFGPLSPGKADYSWKKKDGDVKKSAPRKLFTPE